MASWVAHPSSWGMPPYQPTPWFTATIPPSQTIGVQQLPTWLVQQSGGP
jgi:hypothetical protein